MKYPFRNITLMWRSSRGERRIPIGKIKVIGEGKLRFQYIQDGITEAKGIDPNFDGYPGIPIVEAEYSDSDFLKNVFFLRLINLERNDRQELLTFWLLDDTAASDGVMLLALTQGISMSDMFEFVPLYIRDSKFKRPFISDVAGLSATHFDISTLKVGDKLLYEKDLTNPYDPLAIKILFNDNLVGFIKKGHNYVFKGKGRSRINIYVHKIIKTPHFSRLYVKIRY